MSYYEDIYVLDHIKRYSTVHTIRSESVASHSFFVAAILFKLHEKYAFDISIAVAMAIVHDMPEIELNDVPRTIKVKYPLIAKAFKESEKEVLKKLPYVVRCYLASYEKGVKVEAKMVKFADAIQCMQFSQTEVKLGNSGYMTEVLEASKERIKLFEEEYVIYERENN